MVCLGESMPVTVGPAKTSPIEARRPVVSPAIARGLLNRGQKGENSRRGKLADAATPCWRRQQQDVVCFPLMPPRREGLHFNIAACTGRLFFEANIGYEMSSTIQFFLTRFRSCGKQRNYPRGNGVR